MVLTVRRIWKFLRRREDPQYPEQEKRLEETRLAADRAVREMQYLNGFHKRPRHDRRAL